MSFPCSLQNGPWLRFTRDLHPNDDTNYGDSAYGRGIIEKQQTGGTLHGCREKKKSLTAKVKCQHYHTFLIGCFISTFFFGICFTIAHNEWLAGKLLSHSAASNSKYQGLLLYIFLVSSALQKSAAAAGPGRVSSERTLICSQLAVEATGMDAFGVISGVAAHASLGARTTLHNRS